ncbi:MAG: LOG family protein [Lentisphaeria bacterium]
MTSRDKAGAPPYRVYNQLKAYEDVPFLKTDACRAVRLQLEFLRPDSYMQAHKIKSTIVVFGSARIPDPETACSQLQAAEADAAANPGSAAHQTALCRARNHLEISRYYDVARAFGALVSECSQDDRGCDYVIMTGGGGGIMAAANRGAFDVGAKSVGLNISLPFEQKPNPYIPPELLFHFHYFSIRKMHFLLRAKALCCFPGGYGTMDELFECLTLIQTRKMPAMPVVLFGRHFWEGLINWQKFVDDGLISPHDLEIIRFCETAAEAWGYIRDFWDTHEGTGPVPNP